ncbi:MAG: hypothetical protein ABIK43_02540 [candidate division WOR-3 bacterium]
MTTGMSLCRRAAVSAGLLFSVLAGILLTRCSGREEKPLVLTAPDWRDGELSEYEVIRRDTVIFRRRVLLQFDETAARPLAVVTSVVEPYAARIFLTESITFALRRFSLKPEWLYRQTTTELTITELTARWEDGRVEVRKETVDGSEEKSLRVAEDALAAEMARVALRGLPLEPGTEYRTRMVIPLEFRSEPVTISVLGTRLVKTRLGDILCREVAVTQARRRQSLLYELAQPRRLVEARDPDGITRMVLVRYLPEQADTLLPEVIP